MKSLSSMASDQLYSLGGGNSSSSNRGQVIRSCLPIAVTVLLVFLVGGFPPTTWVLLFQTFGQLNALLAYQGPGAILPLIILIVQSLLLLLAWVLLGWVILREGTYLMTMQSKAELDRLLAFQSTTGELINPSQMVTKQLQLEQDFDEATNILEEEQDFRVTTDPIEEDQNFDEMAALFEEEQDYDLTTAPLGQEEDHATRRRSRQDNVTTSLLRQEEDYAARRRGRQGNVTTAPLRRSKQVDVTTAPLRRGKDLGLATTQLDFTTSRLGVTTSPLRDEEPEEASWASRNIQSRSTQSRSVQLPSVQSRSVSVQSRSMQLPSVQSRSVPSRDIQSRTVQLPEVQSRGVQSRTAQASSVQTRGAQARTAQTSKIEPDEVPLRIRNPQSRNLQSRRSSTSHRGLSTGRLPEEDLLDNPFEKELPSTDETEDHEKQTRTRMVTKKEEPSEQEENEEDDDDNPFVFGNPFDGPLPEVFKYDTELRRSVQELKEEEAAQGKAKGKRS